MSGSIQCTGRRYAVLTVTVLFNVVAHAGEPTPWRLPANQSWCAASKHHLVWDAKALSGPVKLEYTLDAGQTWQDIGTVANSGKHLWTVPTWKDARKTVPCAVRLTQGKTTTLSPTITLIPSQQVDDYGWTLVTKQAAFAPRDGAGALTFAGRMWLIGGWNPSDRKHFPRICNNEVWSSRDGKDWVLEKPNTFLDRSFKADLDWEGRHTAGYVVHRERMWIVGGDVNQGHYHFDVWSSADGKNWAHANKGKPVPWGPRALHYTAAFRDKIWVIGGQTIPGFAAAPESFQRDIWTSADGVAWDKVEPREPYWPQRGMIGGSVVFKDRLWILGGGTYETPKRPRRLFYNDVWSTADGATWQEHAPFAPWEPRQYHDVAVFDERMWVLEGYHPGGNRNDVWYSADGVNWYELHKTPWPVRHAASVFVHDGALWMVAGNNMQSDVWKLQRKR